MQLVSPAGQHLTISLVIRASSEPCSAGSGEVFVREATPLSPFLAGSSPKPPAELTRALPTNPQQQTVAQGEPSVD